MSALTPEDHRVLESMAEGRPARNGGQFREFDREAQLAKVVLALANHIDAKTTQEAANSSVISPDRLVCFLYLLMRDAVPFGTVAALLEEVHPPNGEPFEFTNREVAQLAMKYADKLRKEEVK